MKRLLLIVLAVLLLAGCGRKPQSTQSTEDSSQTDTTNCLYIPDSSAEQQTGGAVRVYELENDTYFNLRGIGSRLLVMGQKGLTVLTGEQGGVTAKLETGDVRSNSVIDTATTGMAYYLPNSRQVVLLNPQLQSINTLELPKEIVDSPCISIVKNEVYYSTGSEIRALNMITGISRLLRQQSAATQTLLGVYFDGTVLLCQLTDADGTVTTEFISTETGQTLGKGNGLSDLQTHGSQYVAFLQDGIVQQTAFGTRGGETKSLLPAQPTADIGGRAALPAMNAVVDYAMTESGLELSFYDLSAGKRTAQTVLPGVQSPAAFYSNGSYIWMLATDTEKTQQALYRWDVTLSPAEDDTVCTGPLYTAENPDTEGLAQCRELANTYEKQYGVKLLWHNDVTQTGGYTVTAEYHPQVINSMLEQLQPVLALFPENFLLKTVEAGWIKIALVQDIDGDSDWVQFWEEGDCWILLSVKADAVSSLIQGMAYGIDSHVLGNSRDFDTWNQLNPEGFDYTYSDTVEGNAQYLTGENRAFTDTLAMTYPHEDRCRIFYHAMLSDNAAMFQSPVMQAKLLRLCQGIREAYSLEKKTVTYAWEQYLQTSLAYVPK